jgi:hypothetical protein
MDIGHHIIRSLALATSKRVYVYPRQNFCLGRLHVSCESRETSLAHELYAAIAMPIVNILKYMSYFLDEEVSRTASSDSLYRNGALALECVEMGSLIL